MISIPLFWILLGLILIGSEFLIPGFVIFFFGAGAILTGALTAILPVIRESLPLQILIWAGSSGLSLALLRKYFAPIFRGSLLSRSEDRTAIGDKAHVLERIGPDQPGRIQYHGTSWPAVTYDDEPLEKDQSVEIMRKEGMNFVVTRSIMEDVFGEDSES